MQILAAKKSKFLIISLIPAALMFINYVVIKESVWLSVVISLVVSIFITSYTLNRIYERMAWDAKQIFFILLLSSVFVLLYFFPTLGPIAEITYIILSTGLLYFTLLSLNIYYVSQLREEDIPLIQPARTIVLTSFVIIAFLGSTTIYKLPLLVNYPIANLLFRVILFFILYYFYFNSSKWIFYSQRVGDLEKNTVMLNRMSVLGTLVLTQIACILMFFPFEDFGRSMLIAGVVYILSNFVQGHLAHKLRFKFILEALLIFIFIYIIVYFL